MVKCCVVGPSGAGKTSSILTYTQEYFPSTVPTTLDDQNLIETVGITAIMVDLLDIASSNDEYYSRMIKYSGTNVAVIMFALNDKESFQEAKSDWLTEVKNFAEDASIVIVGTKADLPRTVSKKEAESFALSIGAGYFEISSKTQEGVKTLFEEVIKIGHKNSTKGQKPEIEFNLDFGDLKLEEGDRDIAANSEKEEIEDPQPPQIKYGATLVFYDKYDKKENVMGKKIFRASVGSLLGLKVELVKTFARVMFEEDYEADEFLSIKDNDEMRQRVKNLFGETNDLRILDEDFGEYFELESYEQLKENAEKSDNIIRLKIVY